MVFVCFTNNYANALQIMPMATKVCITFGQNEEEIYTDITFLCYVLHTVYFMINKIFSVQKFVSLCDR